MAKRAQIASLAISRGGAKRLYLRRAEHLEHRSIALRRRRRRRRGEARLSDRQRTRKGKRRRMEMEMQTGGEEAGRD